MFAFLVLCNGWFTMGFLHTCVSSEVITSMIWAAIVWLVRYLQTANEFKWNRTIQMVLILGNSCDVGPQDNISLMSFLRRRPQLSCLQPRTISYIVSEPLNIFFTSVNVVSFLYFNLPWNRMLTRVWLHFSQKLYLFIFRNFL